MPPAGHSELPRSVDVGAVLDGYNVDTAVLAVDAADHPVVAAASAVQPVQPELERFARPVRISGKGAMQELDRSGSGLLGQQGHRGRGLSMR